jgi:hypothetical protein
MSLESISRKASMTIGDSVDLLLVLAGSGSAASVLEIVKSWLPTGATLTDEQLMTALGFVLWWWGDKIHRRVVPFGFGILVQGGGQIVGPMVSGLLSSFTKPSA